MASKTAKKAVADTKPAAPVIKGTGAQVIQHPLSRVGDSLTNLVTGMGTSKDKTISTQFVFTALDRAQAEAAYRGDWMSRKVIDIPAYDATREWRTWQGDDKDITALEDIEKKFNLQRKFMSVLQKARLYGGAALVLGVDQGKPEEPLEIEKLGKDCLKFVHVVNRYELTAGETQWDILDPWFGQPKYYQRQVPNGQGVKLHPSRVCRFVGAEIPDINQAQGWGDSILQIVADAVIATGTVFQSMTSLVQEAKVDIVKIPELSERISSAEYETRLKTRFAMAGVMKSIYSVLLIDKEEEWERINQVFTGMPEVMQEFLLFVCGAADIPATRFMGQSPKGLNATGDSDTRNYYDRVSTEQKIEITPTVDPLDQIVMIHAFGKVPEGMHYNWNPLWQMTDAEKAEIAVKQANVMTADVNAALMNPLVLQKARENQLIESGFYPGLEQIIDEFGTDQEAEPEPVAGAATPMIDPETGKAPDPNDPEAMARAIPDPNAPPAPPNGTTPPQLAASKGRKVSSGDMYTQIVYEKGDRVVVKKGEDHAGMGVDEVGVIAIVEGTAYGVKFPSMKMIHKWYVASELEPADEETADAVKKRKKKGMAGMKMDEDAFIFDMAARIRDAQLIDASTPRTLYIYRAVLNWRDIAKHYKDQGVENVYGSEMHVTICYSKKPVDWLKVGEDYFGSGSDENGNLLVKPGGARVNESFGKYLVLAFANTDLAYRHRCILDRTDGTWDYDDYTPHVSVSMDPGAVNPLTMKAWTGPIVLGPEVFEEIKPDGSIYEGGTNAPKELAYTPDATPAPVVIPAPVVHVDVHVDAKGKVKKQVTHDASGRVSEIIETPIED